MDVTFVVAVSIFVIFIAFILLATINYFTSVPESSIIIELRNKVKSLFDIFFGSTGIVTNERITIDLNRVPILLEETNGTARTNELVGTLIEFDEFCNKKTSWNNTIRVYDQQFNELPSKISNQEFCTSQWLNNSIVTFVVNMTANQVKRVYIYSINNTNTTAPSHNINSITGIIGYWAFDAGGGTLTKDFSGNQNNGTLTNFDFNSSSGWFNGTSCTYGSCLRFDGRNDYVNATNSSIFQITSNLTITAWVNPTGTASSQRILSKMASNDGYRVEYTSGGVVRLGVFNGGSGGFGDCGSALTTDVFTSIILAFDGSTVQCYKNGVSAGSGSPGISTIGTSTDYLVIGSTSAGDSLYFNGTLDDVRIYNKTLTTSEIASIVNSTRLRVTTFPSETVSAISAEKLQNLTSRNYQDVKSLLGGDFDFRVEISEKQ